MKIRTRLVAALALALVAGHARTTTLERVTMRDRIERASLIFEGTVRRVETRISTVATPNDAALPHTFVTFEVDRVFKGRSSEDGLVTLRFVGGWDAARGLRLAVPGVPEFEPGAREVLFVEANGDSPCPLVGWEQGRIRVVDGQPFTEHREELWLSASGEWFAGECGDRANESESSERRAPRVPPPGAVRPDLDGLRLVLLDLVAARARAGMPLDVPATPSQSPDEPFFVPRPKPLALPAASDDAKGGK